MIYKLPDLPYAYDALEPYIDAKTMEIHHLKHHQAYIDNLNAALSLHPTFADEPLENLLSNLARLPDGLRTAVQNNGGGTLNHTLFWQYMSPKGGGEPQGKLAAEVTREFGGFHALKDQFSQAAKTRFGSGWAWLSLTQEGRLIITSTANQDSPYSVGFIPLLGLDVWEHAYYLKYQNKRVDYVQAWWHVVDWAYVEDMYKKLI